MLLGLCLVLAQAPPQGAYPPPPGVVVELRVDDPRVRLDRVLFNGLAMPACAAPCRQVLDRGSAYVIQGEGIVATSPFLLPDGTNQVVLDVHAGSKARRLLGLGLLAGGAALTLVGFAGVSLGGTFDDERGRRQERNGLIMMGVGVPAAIAGWLLIRWARTSVVSSTGATFSERGGRAGTRAPRLALTAEGLSF